MNFKSKIAFVVILMVGTLTYAQSPQVTHVLEQNYTSEFGNVNMKDVFFKHKPGQVFGRADEILNSKEVILTFDDGPDKQTTPIILDTLKKYNIRAIFFVLGRRIEQGNGREILMRIADEKHAIANHSYSHPGFKGLYAKTGDVEVRKQIVGTQQLIKDTVGFVYPYFRFPGGTFNSELNSLLTSYGLSNWKWNLDSFDYIDCAHTVGAKCLKKFTENEMVENAIKNIKNGLKKNDRGILLFHDIKPQTVKALPYILEYLITEGYTFVLPHPENISELERSPILK